MLYAGLDVSQTSVFAHVVDERGNDIASAELGYDCEEVVRFLDAFYGPLKMVGVEATADAHSICDALRAAFLPVVLMNSQHASLRIRTEHRHKSDRNDARGIAQLVRTDAYKGVWLKSPTARRRRATIVARDRLVRSRKDLANSLRGLFRSVGRPVGSVRPYAILQRAGELTEEMPGLAVPARALMSAIDTIDGELKGINSEIETEAKNDAECSLLMTAPGVGPLVSYTYVSTIDDPRRFRSSRDVPALFGLVPVEIQSGVRHWRGGIRKAGDKHARRVLFQAAHIFMHLGPDCQLKRWAWKLRETKGHKVAKVALARRLAVILHAMWLSGRPFETRLET